MDRQDEHIRRVASAIEHFVPPNTRYLVSRDEGAVSVVPLAEGDIETTAIEPLERALPGRDPALVGRLLTVNEAISSAGVGPMVGIWMLALCACWGIAKGWLPESVGVSAELLQSWWVYVAVIFGGLVAGATASGWSESAAFERHRASLLRAIADEGIDPFALLAELEGDDRFDDVARLLKRSADAGVRRW